MSDLPHNNDSMPRWPKAMPAWQRLMCVLGYHKRMENFTPVGHCFGHQTEEGRRRGIYGIHDESPLRLRDKCSRCGTLLLQETT